MCHLIESCRHHDRLPLNTSPPNNKAILLYNHNTIIITKTFFQIYFEFFETTEKLKEWYTDVNLDFATISHTAAVTPLSQTLSLLLLLKDVSWAIPAAQPWNIPDSSPWLLCCLFPESSELIPQDSKVPLVSCPEGYHKISDLPSPP